MTLGFPARLITFAGNGAINTLLSWLCYIALLHLGLGVSLSYSVSFLFGVALSALLNLMSVFGARHSFRNVGRYGMAYVFMYLVGLSMVIVLVWLGIPASWAPLLVLPVTVPLSFTVIQRTLAFGCSAMPT